MDMFIWNNSKKLCGLQMMDTHVRMIEMIVEGNQLCAGRRYTTELPPCSIVNGVIINEAAVAGCVEAMITSLGLQEDYIHLIVPTSNIVTYKSVPASFDDRELRQFIETDMQSGAYKLCLKQSNMNYIRLGSPLLLSLQEDVLVINTPVEIIQSYMQVVKRVGLELITIEPSLFSLYRAIFRHRKDSRSGLPQRFVLLQTDLGFSEISVFDQGVPIFTFVINGADYPSVKAYSNDLQMEFKRILNYFRHAVFSESKELRHLYLMGEKDWLKKLLQPLGMIFDGNMTLLSLADLFNMDETIYDPYASELGISERGA
jgi:Tfp pilus assembly PilM family ATPase